MNPEIKKYIDTERSRGITDDQIKQVLMTQGGWSDGEIARCFKFDNSPVFSVPLIPLYKRPMFWILFTIQLFLMLDIVFSFLVPTTIFPYFGVLYFILRLCKIFFPVYFFFYMYKHLSISKENFLTICIVLHLISIGIFILNNPFSQEIINWS